MKKYILHTIILSIISILVSCASAPKIVIPANQDKTVSFKARDHFLQGVILQQQARHNEALVEFYQALQYDSASVAIHNAIAENHMKLSHYESAEIFLKKSLGLQTDNREALQLFAECQLRLGREQEAIKAYNRILDQNPYNEDARQYLLILYEKNNDLNGLATQNEQMLQIYGQESSILERLANIYIKLKNYEKAYFYLDELTQEDSTAAQVYYFMGQIKDEQNLPDDAAEQYRKALQFDPLMQGALERLTHWYRTKRDWQAVIDLYQPVLEVDSASGPARVLMAESYYYLQDYDNARQYMLPLVEVEEPEISLLELIGRIEFESKNRLKARDYFRQILNRNKSNKFAWLFLAFTLDDLDSLAQAEKVYEDAIHVFPDDAALWSFYGVNQQNLENYPKSIAAFRRSLDLDSLNTNALSNLPVVYESLKMYAQSDSIYELGIHRLPDNDLLLNNFSYSLSERNIRMQEALEMSQKALVAQPENAAYLDTIGWIYFKLGRLAEAEESIKKSIEQRDGSSVVIEHLADVYSAMGKSELAKTYYKQALEMDQTNEELKLKLEMIK